MNKKVRTVHKKVQTVHKKVQTVHKKVQTVHKKVQTVHKKVRTKEKIHLLEVRMIWLYVTKVTYNTRGGPTSTERVGCMQERILI